MMKNRLGHTSPSSCARIRSEDDVMRRSGGSSHSVSSSSMEDFFVALSSSIDGGGGKRKRKSTTMHHHHRHQGVWQDKEAVALARRETRAVNYLKAALFGVLALSTVGVATGVYFFVSTGETEKFETHFEQGAQKILGSIGQNIGTTLAALDVLVASMVSFAHSTNQTWPFVTVPDFEVRAAKVRSLSNLILVNHLPLVRPGEEREEWERYSIENSDWVRTSMKVQEQDENYYGPVMYDYDVYGVIHGDFGDVPYNTTTRDYLLPNWQGSPVVPVYSAFNYDYLSVTNPGSLYATLESKRSVISEAYGLPDENNPDEVAEAEIWFDWYKNYIPPSESSREPVSDLYMPIFNSPLDSVQSDQEESDLVGMVAATWFWRDLIKDLLPEGNDGFVVVFENDCNPSFSYEVNGPETTYLGRGDLHERKYDKYVIDSDIKDLGSYSQSQSRHSFVKVNDDYCPFHISIFPSKSMETSFRSQDPVVYMCVAIGIFLFTSLLFICYDVMVRRRHSVVLNTAETSDAVVAALYPDVVRDRIKQSHDAKKHHANNMRADRTTRRPSTSRDSLTALRNDMKSGEFKDPIEYLSSSSSLVSLGTEKEDTKLAGSPIAEVYTDTTVMMADIVGFAAWSSAREPTTVFILLEEIYSVFDNLATTYGVFKIESVGDMYVAVCGMPKPERMHAVIMAQFAQDCKENFRRLVVRLESKLGPGTASLSLRVGLNSGSLTAGVLRSDKATFQIFGDTVNVTSEMMYTSVADHIQASQKTAKELMNAGRDYWITPRVVENPIQSEGGLEARTSKTYWVQPPGGLTSRRSSISSNNSDIEDSDDLIIDQLPASVQRLVSWNLSKLEGILSRLLMQTPTREHGARLECGGSNQPRSERSETVFLMNITSSAQKLTQSSLTSTPVLQVEDQNLLSDFISSIAFMYQENKTLPYHDFENSALAAMSAMKMLSTLAPIQESPSEIDRDHRNTYIHLVLSDPMVQLSIMFAILVHAVEHRGLATSDLVTRRDPLADHYGGKSIVAQHSFDSAWDLFMDPGYRDLRSTIFRKSSDITEFRRLVVNSVIATDLEDSELKASQDARWKELFEDRLYPRDDNASSGECSIPEKSSKRDECNHNRRAMLIIEFIIQASVIYEFTQHWKIYEKRRRRHFIETCRSTATAAKSRWYEKELEFFDTVVIPLLTRIKLSGVFCTSSVGMMLEYAKQNRSDWAEQGNDLIQNWMATDNDSTHSLSRKGSNHSLSL